MSKDWYWDKKPDKKTVMECLKLVKIQLAKKKEEMAEKVGESGNKEQQRKHG